MLYYCTRVFSAGIAFRLAPPSCAEWIYYILQTLGKLKTCCKTIGQNWLVYFNSECFIRNLCVFMLFIIMPVLYANCVHFLKGPMLSNALVNAGMISFAKIASTNPRELELVKKLTSTILLLNWHHWFCHFRLLIDILHLATK